MVIAAAAPPAQAAVAPAAAAYTAATNAAYAWSEAQTSIAPLPRDSAAVAYDAATKTVVVSGGRASCGPTPETYTDTWSWDGSAWKQVSTNAPPVFGVPSAYDSATGSVDLIWFAPCSEGITTSQWDGRMWQNTGDYTSFPDNSGAMAYDPASHSLVLWSPNPGSPLGFNSTATPPPGSSTWSWDGSTWHALSPAVSPPPSVGDTQDVQTVDDPKSAQLLLYGDQSQTMWAWDGTNWSQLPVAAGPSPRVGASLVYDTALGEVLLFGGDTVTGYAPVSTSGGSDSYVLGAPLNDLWAWSGGAWQRLQPATSPPARFYSQMAYDDASGQVVLFGGSVNTVADVADTWVYGPG